MYLLLCAIFSSQLLVQAAPNKNDKCFPVYQAINGFLVYDSEENNGNSAVAFKTYTGVDTTDNDQLWEFSCKLTGVETVEDLANILPLSYDAVKSMYVEYVNSLRKSGGVGSEINHLEMRVRMIALGLQYNLTGLDFSKVPVRASKESLMSFFGTLASEFGSNFLDWVYQSGEFRDSAKIFVLNDIDAFASALIESSSVDEVAAKMGFNAFKTRSMLRTLHTFVNEKHGSYISYIQLVKTLQEYGLYDLRV